MSRAVTVSHTVFKHTVFLNHPASGGRFAGYPGYVAFVFRAVCVGRDRPDTSAKAVGEPFGNPKRAAGRGDFRIGLFPAW